MKTDKNRKQYGIFLGLMFLICHVIADYFASGALFKIFTSHNKAKTEFEESATVTIFQRISVRFRKNIERVKKSISRQFENSFMLKAFSTAATKLFGIPGRTFAAFTMTWSAYVIIISLIKRFSLQVNEDLGAEVLCGIITFLASVPLMLTDKTLSALCEESPIVFSVLTKLFGVPPEAMRIKKKTRVGQSVAVIFGIVFGLLTYLVSPLDMIIGVFALVLFALILAYPEGGVIISILIAPFLGLSFAPSRILSVIVLLTAVSYTVKVIRCKRVFDFGITDLSFWGFWIAVLLSGFAPGESNTFEHAILCCSLMLIFPLSVNLMKYRRWIKACVFAFIFPAAAVAFFGIVQYSLGFAPSGWVDESVFGGITSRVVSLFNNPNILGVYLTMMFPFVLTLTLPGKTLKLRVLGYILSGFVVVCTIITFSRSAWIALIAGGVLFALMISPKGILWMIPVSASTVGLALLFPDTVGSRLKNFVSMADSANNYRMAVWNSSWNLLSDVFIGGIGMGEEAFKTAYIDYASSGTQYAMHSHSLYMQIVIQIGLVGLLLFLIFMFNSARRCCSSVAIKSSDEFLSSTAKASLSGALSMLVAGMFDYTWYNYRVFFMFWALIGFACAAANLNDRSHTALYPETDEETMSSVTIQIQKRSETYDWAVIEKEVIEYDGRENN